MWPLEQLLAAAADQPGRTAVAVVACAGSELAQNACELHIDDQEWLTIPALNLSVRAADAAVAGSRFCARDRARA
jgi:hypothetical protein